VLIPCPSVLAPSGPQQVAQRLPAPDDLAFDNQGRLLFSDVNAGSVSLLNGDGSIEKIVGGLDQPEGMLVLADGRILVAEQGRNRVMAIDPQSHALTLWRAFSNQTANAGIDGIGPIAPAAGANAKVVAQAGDIIVPDSPNGAVWSVTPDGRSATEIGRGMVRPVGAAIDAEGRLFIVDEGGAVWLLNGTRHRFATLPTPDDVVITHQGHLFINTLGDNAIHELDSQGHQLARLSGIAQPQGIALDGAENLFYTAFTAGRIYREVRSFLLEQPTASAIAPHTFKVCPTVARAQGFSEPLTLSLAAANDVAVLQAVQPGTDSSGALLLRTTASSVDLLVSDSTGTLRLSQTVTLPS
jgi:sugar lactone lactonase YvrE